MEPTSWPGKCEACKVQIPNAVSWKAHVEGKKHQLKQKEFDRRQDEGGRTIFVSGSVVGTAVTELLLRNYFEENFGAIDKIICQQKFCLVVFDSESTAAEVVKTRKQEFDGFTIQVKPRGITSGSKSTDGGITNKLNNASNLSGQLTVIESFYAKPSDVFASSIQNVFDLLKKEVEGKINFSIDLIGSAKYNLLSKSSDVDINLRIQEVHDLSTESYTIESGRKTIRTEAQCARDERPQTAIVLYLTGKLLAISKTLPLGSVHAVTGARKPVIRLQLGGRKIEISVGNTAASVNTRFFAACLEDHLLLHLVKLVKFIFAHGELGKAGRFTSYSTMIALYAFLISKGIAKSIAELLRDGTAEFDPNLTEDSFCKKQWDYQLPSTTSFSWPTIESKQEALTLLFQIFFEFSSWLNSIDDSAVVDIRSGKVVSTGDFMSQYSLTSSDFKLGCLNIADPFEVEHNTVSHITPRTKHKISKVLKSFAIKSKMKRVTTFINDQSLTGLKDKDWGVSVLISSVEAAPSGGPTMIQPSDHSFDLHLTPDKFGSLCEFMDKVLRISIVDNPMNESLEEMEISPKRAKLDMDISPESFDSGLGAGSKVTCSTSVKLWEGRRQIRRKLERDYKSATPVDLEAQVSAFMLAKQPKKLSENLEFTLQITESNVQLVPVKKCQDIVELHRFLEQAILKYFPA